ncbi:hypothetical protein GCM10007874_36070 [Labrys miyagiensis]|uniref:ANTAR domain-containing protein n=1 Tax=Labrys miyagiensis TaxID=346912 RepID=A0ABQ6CNU1_9HYPH|nr:hypothetical protein [Labrys miyagiensis]GLS20590.1 hypothetical protein GCM10007874_36070 [Labrys miyagiensis]
MRGPRAGSDFPNRFLECQKDMEAAANTIINLAITAGWSEVEACLVVQELADSRLLATSAKAETDEFIRQALAKIIKRPSKLE